MLKPIGFYIGDACKNWPEHDKDGLMTHDTRESAEPREMEPLVLSRGWRVAKGDPNAYIEENSCADGL
jgi:hypothetical protein